MRGSVFWLLLLMQAGSGMAEEPDQCSAGSVILLDTGACLPIDDRRIGAANEVLALPDLDALRSGQALDQRLATQEVPVPGTFSVGTLYRPGAVQAREHGELHTKMFVHKDGVNPSSYLSWLFTPATNRMNGSVEVVGVYRGASPGELGVYDRGCTPEYPCENGATGPAWVWFRPFSDLQCNTSEFVDAGGHLHEIVQYANRTARVEEASAGLPPLWRNSVYLLNFCEPKWDLVYEHSYRKEAVDCSVPGSGGSGCTWGPVVETFDPVLPEVDEVGFADSMLIHDGAVSVLDPDDTRWIEPIPEPWVLFHRDPNRGFGVGNNVVIPTPMSCRPKSDYEPGQCAGTFHVRSEDDLNRFVDSNYGKAINRGRFMNLMITDDLGGSDLLIQSPCQIKVRKGVEFFADKVSLDGREGVTLVGQNEIGAASACLVSESRHIKVGPNSSLLAEDLAILGRRRVALLTNSFVSVRGTLVIQSELGAANIGARSVLTMREGDVKGVALTIGAQANVQATDSLNLDAPRIPRCAIAPSAVVEAGTLTGVCAARVAD